MTMTLAKQRYLRAFMRCLVHNLDIDPLCHDTPVAMNKLRSLATGHRVSLLESKYKIFRIDTPIPGFPSVCLVARSFFHFLEHWLLLSR
jgi:hypothetical protein